MQTAINVQKISLLFFIILGLAYLVATLMVNQGYFMEITGMLSRTLDIPFMLAGGTYAAVSLRLRLNLEGRRALVYDIAATICILLIAGFLLYLNIILPDV